MIAVGYFDGTRRVGLLVWSEDAAGALAALGGFEPRDFGLSEAAAKATTIVTTDGGDRVLDGWVHPDDIAELTNGAGESVCQHAIAKGKY